MQNILLFGAGKSASCLIQFILEKADSTSYQLHIADIHTTHINDLFPENKNLHLHDVNMVEQEDTRKQLIQDADIVLSLLPPHLHLTIAKDCIAIGKHLITASYVSKEMEDLHEAAKEKNVMLMCEMGLDPGIDHMSAMEIMHKLEAKGAKLLSFKSHCGGLVAPDSDTNPWHYKISWNPRNIVNAGKAGAVYLENEVQKELPYEQIFENSKSIDFPEIGPLAYYPNRDSLHYKSLYKLHDIKTLIRTTLRYPSFNKAWDIIIQMGLSTEEDQIDTNAFSIRDWVAQKMDIHLQDLQQEIIKLCQGDKELIECINYLDLLSEQKLSLGIVSSADILQKILESKWKLDKADKDMIVMQHEFEFSLNGENKYLQSSLMVIGENSVFTAMAKTVGLPMGILAHLVLQGKVAAIAGVQIPIMTTVYVPVLESLVEQGIIFQELEK